MVGWLTEFESEELSARMTTEGYTGDGAPPTAHPATTAKMPGDGLALSAIDLMVCICSWSLAESVVGWLTEFESEELSARMTTEGSINDGTAPTAHPATTATMLGDGLALSAIDSMVCIYYWHYS